MIRPIAAFVAVAATALTAEAASAQTADAGVSIGVNAGTPGLGVEAQVRLGSIFVLRGGVDRLSFETDRTFDGVDYGAEAEFDTVSGFVDLHPFASGFLISGGVYVGDRDVRLLATPSQPVEIGGATFTPAEVGTLSGAVKLSGTAPFVGIGWDSTFTRRSRWGLRAVAGVAVSDEPEVALDSSGGTLSNNAAFRARLADEARDIQAEAEDYGLFPVIQIGLNYRF